MSLARCPVCDDVLTFGISVKLNQIIICPTCLSSLQVVCLSPLELELPERRDSPLLRKGNHPTNKQSARRKNTDFFEADDYEDEELFDDYRLERNLRHKSERPRRQKERK